MKEVEQKQKLAEGALNISDELGITDEEVSKLMRQLKIKNAMTIMLGVVIIITLIARIIYG